MSLFDLFRSKLDRPHEENRSPASELKEEVENDLIVQKAIQKLSLLPDGTQFIVDRIEGNFVVGECQADYKMYDIPKHLVSSTVKEQDVLEKVNDEYVIHQPTIGSEA